MAYVHLLLDWLWELYGFYEEILFKIHILSLFYANQNLSR